MARVIWFLFCAVFCATCSAKQYFVNTGEKVSWQRASSICTSFGWQLVNIRTRAEQQEVNKAVETAFNFTDYSRRSTDFWIGLFQIEFNKETSAVRYAWSPRNDTTTYTNWAPYEPNLGYEKMEKCVSMTYNGYQGGSGWLWDDKICCYKLHFVCEREGHDLHHQVVNSS